MPRDPQRLPPPPPPPPYPPFRILRYAENYVLTFPRRPIIPLPTHHSPEEPPTLIRKVLFESGDLSLDETDSLLFSRYNQAVSITQDGPTCGPVALLMAIDSLGLTIPEISVILKNAIKSGYSLHGEMYSAANFSNFIQYVIPEIRGIHITNLVDQKYQMVEHLSYGWPILIPYDSDRNHLPYEANGHNAHWAVLLGFVIEMKKPRGKNIDKILSLWDKDSVHGHLYHLKSSDDGHLLREFITSILANSSRLFFYAKQGKSSKTRLFEFNALIKSNRNLNAVSPYSSRDLLVPEGGVRAGLSDQAILIKPIASD